MNLSRLFVLLILIIRSSVHLLQIKKENVPTAAAVGIPVHTSHKQSNHP